MANCRVTRVLLVACTAITSSNSSLLRASSLVNHQFRNVNPGNHKLFASSSEAYKINTKINFSVSDSDEEEEVAKTRKLPPPYDPFSKKPVVEEAEDPKNLQEIFHKMRTDDGVLNNAAKMFDGLSKDGLTHEALQLFSEIKDKGKMPDVVAHTAVVEAYLNAAQCKEAHKVYLRMLASGVTPNAYTYSVLIKGLAADPKFVSDARTYLLEMMSRGFKPNAGTYTAVFEALVRDGKVDEATQLLIQMKTKGFLPNEKDVKAELLHTKRGRGPLFRTVINILFNK